MSFLACLLLASSLPAAEVKKVAVELGKPFRLEKAEVAYLPGKRASLRIEKFIDSPCPTGAYCVWSGQAVIPELTVDGKVMRSGAKDAPYDVEVKESDYKTYAVFVVDEPEKACARLEAPKRSECLRSLAVSRGSPRLCRAIKDERARERCLEELSP